MNPPLVLALVALVLQLSMASLAVVIGRAPGWRRVRWVVAVSLTAAAYSANNVMIGLAPAEVARFEIAVRLNLSIAAVHTAAWVGYAYSDDEGRWSSIPRALRWLATGAAAATVLANALDLTFSFENIHRVARNGRDLNTLSPSFTVLGSLLVVASLVLLVVSAVRHVRRWRSGEPGASGVVLGFVIFFGCVLEEVAVAAGAFDFIYLADVGYIAVVLAVMAQLMRRLVRDARRLELLSSRLGEEVARRTAERDAARESLLEGQRLAALGRLAAGVGHEINNPLQYLRSSLEELRDVPVVHTVPAAASILEQAFDGVDRIRRVVEDLRTYARPADSTGARVDLVAAVHTAIRIGASQWRDAVTVETALGEVPPVRGDEGRLVQLLLNLLVNAAQAMTAGPRTAAGAHVIVHTRLTGDGIVELTVTDTGPGFPPALLGRLGEPYLTTRAATGGTGLGLFLSRGIAEAHGGEMTFANRAGAGATVTLRLPAASPAATAVASPEASLPAVARAGPLRVLLVEDEDSTRVALARGLEREGLSVVAVAGGRAALAALEREVPDLVVTDLMMPDMAGWELAAQLAARYPELRARLVVLTGGAATAEAQAFLDDTSLLVIDKPVSRQAFAAALRDRAA